jgi:hypothetical protein
LVNLDGTVASLHTLRDPSLRPPRAANLQEEGRALGALVELLGWKGTQAESYFHLDESRDVVEVNYG